MQGEIRLPRLVRLVREARLSPNNITARRNATQLATDMYLGSLELWVDELREQGFLWEVPNVGDDKGLIPRYFAFKTMRVLRPLGHYWLYRCLVCSLVLSLCDIVPSIPTPYEFNVSAVAAEHIRAAENLAKTTQYAVMTSRPFPSNGWRQRRFLTMAFGAWWRLASRTNSLAELERATDMQAWVVQKLNMSPEIGLGSPTSVEVLGVLHDILAGGPLSSA